MDENTESHIATKNDNEGTELEPLSYEEVIECIQANKEVPNAINVPDIVLSSDMISKSSLPIRPKPWEINQQNETATIATTTEPTE